MLISATRDTKFRKLCFNGHPRYTSTNVHKTHTIYVFFKIFILFLYEKQNKTKLKISKQKHVKQNKA